MNFWSVISLTCIIWFIAFILYIIFPASGVMWWMMGIFSLIFGITLRLTIAQRDAINTPGGCFTELCIGLWCAPCSIAQSKPTLSPSLSPCTSVCCNSCCVLIPPSQWPAMSMDTGPSWTATAIRIARTSTSPTRCSLGDKGDEGVAVIDCSLWALCARIPAGGV